jgi:hypothetical protein
MWAVGERRVHYDWLPAWSIYTGLAGESGGRVHLGVVREPGKAVALRMSPRSVFLTRERAESAARVVNPARGRALLVEVESQQGQLVVVNVPAPEKVGVSPRGSRAGTR